MGPVTDVPLLDRGSPETEQGPAVANPRIRVCSTVVFSAAPCHARSSAKDVLPSRSGDERSCLMLWKKDMRVVADVTPRCIPGCRSRVLGRRAGGAWHNGGQSGPLAKLGQKEPSTMR